MKRLKSIVLVKLICLVILCLSLICGLAGCSSTVVSNSCPYFYCDGFLVKEKIACLKGYQEAMEQCHK